MTTFAPGRVRVELWDDLPAAGGVRRAFVSGEQAVLSVDTPDMLDFSAEASLALVPTPDLVAALETYETPVWRLVPVAADGAASTSDVVEHWRGRTWELALAPGQATLTATAMHPLLDWDAVGRVRTVTTGGITSYVLSGDYTPTQALTLAVGRLADAGRSYWAIDFVQRSDIKTVEISALTPLQLAHSVAALWDSELFYRVNAGETLHLVGLRSRVGFGAAVPTLRYDEDGALLAVTRRADATDLAHEVEPLGAGGATMARAGWSVEGVSSPTITVKDPSGGYGPVQIAGQWVGNYVRDTAGALHQIVATTVVDAYTSTVQLASVAAFAVTTPRQHVELAADASGTLLTRAADLSVAAAKRVSVVVDRSDLTGDRNYQQNPRGAVFTVGSPPWNWVIGGGTGTLTRGTPPAGCPIGDDGTGQMWEVTLTSAFLTLPATAVLDAPNGDNQIVASFWVYLVAGSAGDDLSVSMGTFGSTLTLTQADAGAWMRLDIAGTLPGAQAVQLRVDQASPSHPVTFWLAAAQVARAAGGSPPWCEYERPRVNLLVQAANGHLLGHRRTPRTYPSATVDEAVLAASGTPLVTGGDVRLVVADYGLDVTARYVGRRRARHAAAPTALTLVEAPDPVAAAITGSASPGRPLLLSELLAAEAAGQPSKPA